MSQIPPQIIFATGVEMLLVLFTSALLVQPESLFARSSETTRRSAMVVGMIFLCLTFCWSVVLGIVLVVQNLMMRI